MQRRRPWRTQQSRRALNQIQARRGATRRVEPPTARRRRRPASQSSSGPNCVMESEVAYLRNYLESAVTGWPRSHDLAQRRELADVVAVVAADDDDAAQGRMTWRSGEHFCEIAALVERDLLEGAEVGTKRID